MNAFWKNLSKANEVLRSYSKRNVATIFSVVMLLGFFSNLLAAPIQVPKDEALQTSAAVFELFEAKCNDCHGSHLEKPKGKFGNIVDFKRIAQNPDYVVPGDPEKSEFFRLVNEDEMPGPKSKIAAATAAEKLALRHWITIGAPAELPEAQEAKRKTLIAMPKGSDTVKSQDSVKAVEGNAFFSRFLSWLGRFHAASTHFPVGLLVAAVLSEVLAMLSHRASWLVCTRFLVTVGAVGAVSTTVLGWLNDYSGVSAVYQFHQWIGTATALWAVISAGCALFFECREGTADRYRLRVTLFIGAILVLAAGFLGGLLVYGVDHYKW